MAGFSDAGIDRLDVEVFTVPTESPEADGTIEWTSTTIIVVHATAGGVTGLGYSYTDAAAAALIRSTLADVVVERPAVDVEGAYVAMVRAVRNIGRDGVAACAISAVDNALWDLKARLLDVSLVALLGGVRDAIAVYGSGGFTSYSIPRLSAQLEGWARDGIRAVKMKIGRDPAADRERVRAARRAIGDTTELFVDANGAYDCKVALEQAERFAASHVSWFEEPVSSDDLEGLRLIRERVPAGMDVAAGEYGYDLQYFRRMMDAASVDVLQADATRCGGITGFLKAGALADAFCLPMSAHTAPALHAHLGCAVSRLRHLEYFYDHVRIEQQLFDGVLTLADGTLTPDRSRSGNGLRLKRVDAQRLAR
jgi:L-alanine-DL-glutamate epimerase-like enolase superfamily enzyme